ncbi:MAG: tetratricopeptide repeat protein, partial [Nitrospira sp.]|nr:tetratricopeptide repeat protein [Nitrospira sp.]
MRRAAYVLAALSCLVAACQSAPPSRAVPPVIPTAMPVSPRVNSSLSDSRASYHFLLGYQAELEQETEQAIKEYQLALQNDSSSNYLKARLAVLYFTAGDVPTAVRYADEVADVPGLDAQMLGQIGGMYAAAGKPDQGLRLFNRAIEQEPQRSEHFFAKGLLLANQKQYTEAEDTIRSGIKVSPDSAVGYYYLGRIGVEARDFDKATTHFEQAVTLNAAFEPAYVALGSVYEAKQDREKAIGIYRRYLQGVNPKNREIRHHLIRLQVSVKQYTEALQELEGMLAEDPSDLDAQLRMGLVYGEQKNYPKAIQQLNHILTVRPAELKVRDYLGYLYEETKDYPNAVEAYHHNLTLEPSYFEGHLHMGVLQYRLKQYADAIQHLREASRLNPKQPES